MTTLFLEGLMMALTASANKHISLTSTSLSHGSPSL